MSPVGAAAGYMLHQTLATAFLAGELDVASATVRAATCFAKPPRWLPALARRFVAHFSNRVRPRFRDALAFLHSDGFLDGRTPPPIVHWLTPPAVMQPVPAADAWLLPPLVSTGDLATWLEIPIPELEWLADRKGLARPGHYHYQSVAKQSGASRLLESPKPRIKSAQTQILRGILDQIPGHPAVHGFRKGRSVLTFTAPHIAQPLVLRMDLRDFFPTITYARCNALFRTLGYPDPVATLLAALSTNAAPTGGPLYQQRHLPQGAPTSPALANLAFYRADCRLSGLARATGLTYTRYADDLAFSGAYISENLQARIGAIVLEEGFELQYRKTRLMPQSVRQHLAGLTVNTSPNIDRRDYDRLKATLHQYAINGPAELTRAHLTGRVSWVESVNPVRGAKLRRLLDQISWPPPVR